MPLGKDNLYDMARMAKLTYEEVRHVAKLAKLPLTPKQLAKFQSQLINIFDYIGQIGEMKTEKITSAGQVTEIKNRFREDKIWKETRLSSKEATSCANRVYKGYFVVESIFER